MTDRHTVIGSTLSAPRLALGVAIILSLAAASPSARGDEIGPLKRDAQGNIVPAGPAELPAAPVVGPVHRDTGGQVAPAARANPPAAPRGPAPAASSPREPAALGGAEVTHIAAEYHDGQTFITWKDAAEGEADARYRYSLYRSETPITEQTLAAAKVVEDNIIYNSAKLYGTDFAPKDRLDPSKPTAKTHSGGAALPQWSGLAVYTAQKAASAYYAVVATDPSRQRLSRIVPGDNATIAAVSERVAAPQPIEMYDAKQRKEIPEGTERLHQPGLPLMLGLHASEAQGGPALPYGDEYLYFGTEQMGYRDGIPGVFSVAPAIWFPGHMIGLFPRDAILNPTGSGAVETLWFGYLSAPEWATDRTAHAFPFTENRLLWMINWTIQHYRIDPNRVYASGYSMGGWGTMSFAYRHPELFAAIFPEMPRIRQRGLATLVGAGGQATLPDGSDYFERMDMARFATQYPGELPFVGWSIGRHDGFAAWKEQVDMAHALAAAHRGFVFAWNNGGHSDGPAPMATIWKYYAPDKFSRDMSYPAFAESSIDGKLGNGDPEDGDKEGGINLGFAWSHPVDTEETWSSALSNALAKGKMTVDVTPRRTQKFKPEPGAAVAWRASSGQSGTVSADRHGLVTIHALEILPGKETALTLTKH